MTTSESGVQLFSRLGARQTLQGIDAKIFPDGFPNPGDTYEIYGEEGTGKSEFLLHLVVRAIVPVTWNGLELNGLGVGVIFIDTEYKFNMLRLSMLLEGFISHAMSTREDSISGEVETIIKVSLKNFWLIRCNSSEQLLITLHSLDSFIASKFEISAIMIDSVGSFHWMDKLKSGDNRTMVDKLYQQIIEILEKLVKTYNLVLFTTKSAIISKRTDAANTGRSPFNSSSASSAGKNLEHFEYLPNSWSRFVQYRLLLSKDVLGLGAPDSSSAVHRINFTDKTNTLGHIHFNISSQGLQFLETHTIAEK